MHSGKLVRASFENEEFWWCKTTSKEFQPPAGDFSGIKIVIAAESSIDHSLQSIPHLAHISQYLRAVTAEGFAGGVAPRLYP